MRRPSSIFSHPTFNKIRIIILILAIAISVSACTPTGAIDSSESREAVEAALKAEISRLEAEIDGMAETITSLEDQIRQGMDVNTTYSIEAIIEQMADRSNTVEIFSANINSVSKGTIDGRRYYEFDIIRHRPGWGWEITLDEEEEGYPIADQVRSTMGLVFEFKRYDDPQDLINKIQGYDPSDRYNFLMINDNVVFISPEMGP